MTKKRMYQSIRSQNHTGVARSPTVAAITTVISHPDFATAHPTGSHPERQERLKALLEAFPDAVSAEPAQREHVELCHDASYVDSVRAASARSRSRPAARPHRQARPCNERAGASDF